MDNQRPMTQKIIKARDAAWLAIGAALGSAAEPLDEAMNAAMARPGAVQEDRPFATELAYGVVRHKMWLDHVLARHLKSGLDGTPPGVLNLLRLGVYQVLFIESVPVFASVSETVNLARRVAPKAPTGLINAVLRRVAERKGAYQPAAAQPHQFANTIQYLSTRYSLPEWITARLVEIWGENDAEQFAAASLREAPLTVRFNSAKGPVETFKERAASLDFTAVEPLPYPPDAMNLRLSAPPGRCAAFRDGWVSAQDAAAQLVSLYIDPQPGECIIDLCAAPGGKATHLAALAGPSATIHAIDISEKRCALIRENAVRLGLPNIRVQVRSEALMRELAAEGADRVLVDAPCSGLGVLRRHPDIKWHRSPKQIDALFIQQLALLSNAATIVKSGGTIVYSTCTVLPEENQIVVKAFMRMNPEWRLDDLRDDEVTRRFAPDGSAALPPAFVQPLPHRQGTDGFFIARLRRH